MTYPGRTRPAATTPCSAGKDNFAADRASADQLRHELPSIDLAAKELRRFLERAVHYLAADCGVRQFLDIGCGLPHTPNVHEIAQAVDPTCRIAYVDPDPLVGAHARALLASHLDGGVVFVPGSLDDISTVLADEDVRELLDFTQPIAVLLLAVLHLIPDNQHVQNALHKIKAAIPPGSYVALSHVTFDPLTAEHADRLTKLSAPGAGHGLLRGRTQTEVTALLDGLEPEPPGVVSVVDWHPDRHPAPEATAAQAIAYGAIARVHT